MQYSSLEEPASGSVMGSASVGGANNNHHTTAAGSSDRSRSSKARLDDDAVSYKTSKSHRSRRTITSELEEPLNEVELGKVDNTLADEDPFYVLRNDLFTKLELVDESLAEFLRIVYQTVRKTRAMRRNGFFYGTHCLSYYRLVCSYCSNRTRPSIRTKSKMPRNI